METQFKTQCPHCATQFKLSEKQLAQAGGMVRCGNCLQPFQARDHLINEASATPVTQAAPRPTPAPVKPAAPAPQQQAKPAAPKPAVAPAKPATTATPAKEAGGSRWQMPDAAPAFRAEEDTLSLGEAVEISDELEGIKAGGFTDFNGGDFGNAKGAGRGNLSSDDDESWARALLDEIEQPAKPDAKQKEAGKPAQAKTPRPAHSKPAQAPASLFDFDDSELDLGSTQDTRRSQYQDAMTRASHDTVSYFIKWGSLSVLLVAILGVQYLVFNFQQLAREPGYRPYYQQACELFRCQLPESSNTHLLQATNLLVRSVGDQPGVLLVDLLLHNEADHPQPFPRLQLTFSDLHDQLLAAGIFLPAQYLQNDLAGMKDLPAQAQVHLSFRITDPGTNAKNYSLQLLPPDHA